MVEGRNFSDGDGADALPVVIINQEFARRLFHNLDPVGQYILRFDTNLLIVGVVTDTVGSTAGTIAAGRRALGGRTNNLYSCCANR